jgi:hypothetical protein
MAILILPNTALERAIGRVISENIEAVYTGENQPNIRQYQVKGSTGNFYQVELWRESGNYWGKCNCAAHTGEKDGQGEPLDPNHIPMLCKHLAAAYCEEASLMRSQV